MKANILILLSVSGLLMISFQNCGKLTAVDSSSLSLNSSSTPIESEKGSFNFSAPSSVESNLLNKLSIPVNISSVSLNSDVRVVLTPDPEGPNFEKLNSGDISYKLNQSVFNISPGDSKDLMASIDVSDKSYSFENGDLLFQIYSGNDLLGSSKLSLSVKPIVDIKMYGNQSSKAEKYNISSDLNLRTHFPNLKIRFTNYDSRARHVIHGTGAIPHGSTSSPLMASTGPNSAGGVYEVTILPTQINNGSFYYHDLGDSADRFKVNVNTDLNDIPLELVSQKAAPVRKPNSAVEESCH